MPRDQLNRQRVQIIRNSNSQINCDSKSRVLPDDARIRAELLSLVRGGSIYGDPDLAIEELSIGHGKTRIDLAFLGENIGGIEIKSRYDSLRRLNHQSRSFSEVFDWIRLVLAPKHAKAALSIVPDWWGIDLVAPNSHNSIEIRTLRPAQYNLTQKSNSLVKLLWRDEALKVLESINEADGLHSKPRAFVYQRLVETMEFDDLHREVIIALKHRTDWRSGGLHRLGGD